MTEPRGTPPSAVTELPESTSQWIVLGALSLTLVFGFSTWFSAAAVIPQLDDAWELTSTSKAWLTIAVVLGFVAGALVSAALNISDRIRARYVILIGGLGAAASNALLVAAGGPGLGIAARFATGFFIAGVYPPAFKLISTWFQQARGFALGTLAGAITLGNATPHLVNALGGVGWRTVIYVTSVLSAAGAFLAFAVREGPHPFPRSVFDPGQVGKVFANRGVRLASIGYFGHMWELVAMYSWFVVFLSDHFEESGRAALPAAALITFFVVAAGGLGSFVAGVLADRWGRTNTAALSLAASGGCSLGIGVLFGGPTWLVVCVGLVWGFAIVADSAQFSAMVTEVADQSYVGTALTMQVAVGFTITIGTIWLIPIVESAIGWRWAFTILALGPLSGITAMRRLKSLPEAAQIAGGRG